MGRSGPKRAEQGGRRPHSAKVVSTALPPRARALIRKLGLEPHPEGGYFRELHRSAETVTARRGRRSAVTLIYFLLPRGDRSLFHRVESDEIWHHCEGAPLRLVRLDPDFNAKEEMRLGPLGRGTAPVAVIPRGHWQAAESLGDYTLVACAVGPGFDFADFRMVEAAAGRRIRARFRGLGRFLGH